MTLTRRQRLALRTLAASGDFMPLAIRSKTARVLLEADLIFETTHATTGATWYKITGRGRKALAPKHRTDGKCSKCGIRPHGNNGDYCKACRCAYGKAWYTQRHTEQPCARCGQGERVVYGSGRQSSNCAECLREKNKRNWQRRPEGLCASCKQRPRHISPAGDVRAYCIECNRRRNKQWRLAKGRYLHGNT